MRRYKFSVRRELLLCTVNYQLIVTIENRRSTILFEGNKKKYLFTIIIS